MIVAAIAAPTDQGNPWQTKVTPGSPWADQTKPCTDLIEAIGDKLNQGIQPQASHAYNLRMTTFTLDCRRCDRLASFLDEVKAKYPDYHAKPVPSFGDANARLLIVGLAPGMHGANATGRPFTGDHAGILLYTTLFETGFANQSEAVTADDGLELLDCRITNA